jgi:hypothetical protein
MKTFIFMSLLSSLTILTGRSQSTEDIKVADAVEQLRIAMIEGDKVKLTQLTSEALSYGHSSGRIEDRSSFVQTLASGQSDFTSITLSEQTVKVIENTAVVRHKLQGETNDNGKPGTVNLGVILVWQKQNGEWKLLARQAFKL